MALIFASVHRLSGFGAPSLNCSDRENCPHIARPALPIKIANFPAWHSNPSGQSARSIENAPKLLSPSSPSLFWRSVSAIVAFTGNPNHRAIVPSCRVLQTFFTMVLPTRSLALTSGLGPSFQVNASGILSFFLLINSSKASSVAGSSAGAS